MSIKAQKTIYNSTMKTALLILITVGVVAAAPKVNFPLDQNLSQASKLHFRNLFKQPLGEIKVKSNSRIIGGQEAPPHSIPYQAFLEVYSQTEGWYCGGTLISPSDVFTAAHCNEDAQEAYVTLGDHRLSETESTQITIISTNLRIHPEWDSENLVNDVGIVKLGEFVALTDAIQVVNLPGRADVGKTYAGETARVSGWGVTDGFSNEVSDVLNYVDVPVITNSECEGYFGLLPESNICTSGDAGTGSCYGDSGGPLIIDGVLIGAVSFGAIFCLEGRPSAYSRVTSFLDFIEENADVHIE